jgi:hypothetical protein
MQFNWLQFTNACEDAVHHTPQDGYAKPTPTPSTMKAHSKLSCIMILFSSSKTNWNPQQMQSKKTHTHTYTHTYTKDRKIARQVTWIWLTSGVLRPFRKCLLPPLTGRWTCRAWHLWNVDKYPPQHTEQHPRWQPSSYSSPWEPEIPPNDHMFYLSAICHVRSGLRSTSYVSQGTITRHFIAESKCSY